MVIVLLVSYRTVCCTFFSMMDTLVTVQTSSPPNAYSAEQVLLNKQQLWSVGACPNCYWDIIYFCTILRDVQP